MPVDSRQLTLQGCTLVTLADTALRFCSCKDAKGRYALMISFMASSAFRNRCFYRLAKMEVAFTTGR